MDTRTILANYLSVLEVELYTAQFGTCAPDWRDLDYTPDYAKFYFICSGEGWLRIDGKEYSPTAGELVLMPEGVPQSYSYVSERTYTKYWCHFSARVNGIDLFKFIEVHPVIRVPDPARFRGLLNELIAHFNGTELHSRLMARAKLAELIGLFFAACSVETVKLTNGSKLDTISRVTSYIRQHLHREIVLQELAELAHMHPNSLIRTFRNHTGSTPIQYINERRLEHAQELLLSSSRSIGEIAELSGFSDVFYFSKLFKKNRGVTPSEFRHGRR